METLPSADCLTTLDKDRRREIRFASNHTEIQVRVEGSEQPVRARIVEVSRSGLQLLMAEPLPIGLQVHIEISGLIVHGDVRRCHEDNRSYVVGVLMREVAGQS